ncbi:MAG: bifunctional folylpolyglutamate synthase/dihydrofolate synthase [Alphaproteobacteria bacterium]
MKSDVLLERLLTLHPKLIDLSLGRIERLLAALDHPERRLPPVVHVAGTNGKGSVIAYLRAMLEAAGYAVHVYTSPHLVRFHERIRLAGELVAESDLADLLAEVETANAGEPITFFEVTTAAAFLAFARVPADLLLLESGLGGRLDATNVIARPALTVITPVSIDHTQYLGEGLAAIAGEKAGILKPGVAAVLGPQEPEAARVLAGRAAALACPLARHGVDFIAEAHTGGMRYHARDADLELPLPALPGPYQIDNAATAIAGLDALADFRVDAARIATGLRRVDWPARMQRLERGPLAACLPGDWELWLDSGHNAAAGAALAKTLAVWRDRPLYLVVGMLNTRDPADFLRPLAPLAHVVGCVAIPGANASFAAEDVAAAARTVGLAATAHQSVVAALRALAEGAAEPARVLICGSIYLAGTVLAENG